MEGNDDKGDIQSQYINALPTHLWVEWGGGGGGGEKGGIKGNDYFKAQNTTDIWPKYRKQDCTHIDHILIINQILCSIIFGVSNLNWGHRNCGHCNCGLRNCGLYECSLFIFTLFPMSTQYSHFYFKVTPPSPPPPLE